MATAAAATAPTGEDAPSSFQLTTLDEQGVATLFASLGFPFYQQQLKGSLLSLSLALSLSANLGDVIDHGITGDILVHLDHEALKDVGIHSVGQRLAILRAVYRLKVEQNIPVEEGGWVPPCRFCLSFFLLLLSLSLFGARRWGGEEG